MNCVFESFTDTRAVWKTDKNYAVDMIKGNSPLNRQRSFYGGLLFMISRDVTCIDLAVIIMS